MLTYGKQKEPVSDVDQERVSSKYYKIHLSFWSALGLQKFEIQEASADIFEGIKNWRLWVKLSELDIRRRYRRTKLGPFWTSLSMAIFIFSMGFVFSTLWKMDIQTYLPYLCTGFIAWLPISSVILESAMVFAAAGGILSSVRTPHSIFCLNLVTRNLIVMAHHMVVYALVVVCFEVDINGIQILFFLGVALFAGTATWVALLLGMLCTRYRDITPLLTNILQITMFVSPIFWPAEQLGRRGVSIILVDLNPFYHFVEVMRSPLLGKVPSLHSYLMTGSITLIGWVVTFWLYSRYRRRIIYWI